MHAEKCLHRCDGWDFFRTDISFFCRVRQVLGEALTAEDDAAVLQELEELEGKEAQAEASELPAAPKVSLLPIHTCVAFPRFEINWLRAATLNPCVCA